MSALEKAMSGEKVSEGQVKGALSEAVDKLKNLGGRISKAKEVSENLAEAVIATAETQGTVFAASFVEGYYGEEKMDIGPVDMRLAGGIVTGGYGLYQTMTGKGGAHALAVGNGLMATGIGRVGRNAGKALAENVVAHQKPPKSGPARPGRLPRPDGPGYFILEPFRFAFRSSASLSRKERPSIARISAWWVSRSSSAVTQAAPGKCLGQS